MKTTEFPPGWDEERVRNVIDDYEGQTDEEAVEEHEAALAHDRSTLIEVPRELVPVVRELIARHQGDKDAAR